MAYTGLDGPLPLVDQHRAGCVSCGPYEVYYAVYYEATTRLLRGCYEATTRLLRGYYEATTRLPTGALYLK